MRLDLSLTPCPKAKTSTNQLLNQRPYLKTRHAEYAKTTRTTLQNSRHRQQATSEWNFHTQQTVIISNGIKWRYRASVQPEKPLTDGQRVYRKRENLHNHTPHRKLSSRLYKGHRVCPPYHPVFPTTILSDSIRGKRAGWKLTRGKGKGRFSHHCNIEGL